MQYKDMYHNKDLNNNNNSLFVKNRQNASTALQETYTVKDKL